MSDFKAKMHQIRFPLGIRSITHWLYFMGPLEREGIERERERRGMEGGAHEKCKA